MGRIKKYKNAAEKQRAWRIRTGKQKQKVPLEIRRGQELGAQETKFRERKEGESWQEYHEYIQKSVSSARYRQERAGGAAAAKEEKGSAVGARRANIDYAETEWSEDYYELRVKYEKELEALIKKQKGGKIGEKK